MVFESLKAIDGSNIKRHILERREYFGVCEQFINNEFIRNLSRAYGRAARQVELQRSTNQGELKQYFKDILEVKHIAPISNYEIAAVIVALDCKAVIEEGRGMLPHDIFDYLSEVHRQDLVRNIERNHTQPKLSLAEIQNRKEQERKAFREKEEAEQKASEERRSGTFNPATGERVEKKPKHDAGYSDRMAEHLRKLSIRRKAEAANASSEGQ